MLRVSFEIVSGNWKESKSHKIIAVKIIAFHDDKGDKMKKPILLTLFAVLAFCLIAQQEVPIRRSDQLIWKGKTAETPDGGKVIVWQETALGDSDIFAQGFGSDGFPLWPENCQVAVLPGYQNAPAIMKTTNGNYLITWSHNGIWGQMINLQGQKLWPNEGIQLLANSIDPEQLTLVPNLQCGAFLVFTDAGFLQAKSIDALGNSLWVPGVNNLFELNPETYIQTAIADGADGFLVNLLKGSYPEPDTCRIIRYNSAGEQVGSNPLLAPAAFPTPDYKLIAGFNNQFVVYTTIGSNPATLIVQKMDNQGNLLLPEALNIPIASSTYGVNLNLHKASYSDSFYCRWEYRPTYSDCQIRIQKFSSDFNALWAENGLVITDNNNSNRSVSISENSSAFLGLCWVEGEEYNTIHHVKAQMLSASGEMQWPVGGITLCNGGQELPLPIVFAGANQTGYVWYVEEDSQHRLKYQILNSSGQPQLSPDGAILSSQMGGHCRIGDSLVLGERFLTLWADFRPGNYGIYYQLSDAQLNTYMEESGSRLYPPSSAGPSFHQAINMNNGNVAVLYSLYANNNSTYYIQVIEPAGYPHYPDFGIALGQFPNYAPNMSVDGNDFYLTWMVYPSDGQPNYLIKGQRYVNGQPAWEIGGHTIAISGEFSSVRVMGRYFVWRADGASKVKLVDESGNSAPGWGTEYLDIFENGGSNWLNMGLVGDDLLLYLNTSIDAYSLTAQVITPQGEKPWGPNGVPLISNPEGPYILKAIYGESSSCVYQTYGADRKLYVQKLDENGNKLFGENGVQLSSPGTTTQFPSLYQNVNGWYSICWASNQNSDTGYDIYYRSVSPQGVPSSDGPNILCSAPLSQNYLRLTGQGNHTFAVWEDNRSGANDSSQSAVSIYAACLYSGGTAAVDEIQTPSPAILHHGNFPNPFNPSTTLSFTLGQKGSVRADIYNLRGQNVRKLVKQEIFEAGVHQLVWDGRDERGQNVSSGVYLYRLQSGNCQVFGKMLMLK